jgi:hypothetical protein
MVRFFQLFATVFVFCLLFHASDGFLLPSSKLSSISESQSKKIDFRLLPPSACYAVIDNAIGEVVTSLFRYEGQVPFVQAFGANAVLFGALSSKLNKMLTPTGFAHSLALGTMLWNTLGWRGWSLCVVYLFLGQTVTKVKFAEKEKKGIAEKRGGRRGPENVW